MNAAPIATYYRVRVELVSCFARDNSIHTDDRSEELFDARVASVDIARLASLVYYGSSALTPLGPEEFAAEALRLLEAATQQAARGEMGKVL